MFSTTTTPFSLEKPVFVLDKFDQIDHDETDVYGVDMQFEYSSGRVADVYAFSMGSVSMRVGGTLNNPESGGTSVQFRAQITFPPIREAHLEGRFVTEIEPEYDELEAIAGGLIRILANKRIKK